jgi:hypothetical protein
MKIIAEFDITLSGALDIAIVQKAMGANGAAVLRSSAHPAPVRRGALSRSSRWDRAPSLGGLRSVPSAAVSAFDHQSFHAPLDPVGSRSNLQAPPPLGSEDPCKYAQDLPLCAPADPSPQPDLLWSREAATPFQQPGRFHCQDPVQKSVRRKRHSKILSVRLHCRVSWRLTGPKRILSTRRATISLTMRMGL